MASPSDQPGGREPIVPLEFLTSSYRYWPRNGYLLATFSTAAPYSAAEAFRIYGAELLHAAVKRKDGLDGAAIPGQEWRRRRYHLWQRWKIPVICLAAPLIAPLAAAALVALVLAVLVWPPVLGQGSTMSHGRARRVALFFASGPAAVFTVVLALWFMLYLPPAGAARWLVAAEVAAIAMFAALFVWLPAAAFSVASVPERRRP